MGTMTDRRHRTLTDEDIKKITDTYRSWRGEKNCGKYEDVLGFCKSAELKDVEKNNFILTPGRYVGVPEEIDDGEPFEKKMKRLTKELEEQFVEGKKLEGEIKINLRKVGGSI